MLSKIAMLDSAVIRALLLAVTGLIGLILSFFGVSEALFSEKAVRLVDALLLVLTTGATLYAAYARATKPTPPITDEAVAKTIQMVHKQGGFARAFMLAFVLAIATPVFLSVAGCQSLGMTAPQSYDQRVAYARGQLTGFVNATAAAVENGQLPKEDGVRVLDLAKNARAVLEAGDAAQAAGDISTAEGRLALAIGILQQLQSFTSKEGT